MFVLGKTPLKSMLLSEILRNVKAVARKMRNVATTSISLALTSTNPSFATTCASVHPESYDEPNVPWRKITT